MQQNNQISLKYLFFTFLKIGSISWGGFMALIAVVQKEFVDKNKIVKDEIILDGISLATVLPGPVAFNVVAYLGYHLRGLKGALVSMVAIILPSFLLILALAYVYSNYGQIPALSHFFLGVLPAVSAVIISVAANMGKKQLKDYSQVMIGVFACLTLIFIRSFFATLAIIFISSVAGYLLYHNKANPIKSEPANSQMFNLRKFLLFCVLILAVVFGLWLMPLLFNGQSADKATLLQQIAFTFSGLSLTLFGGGYVIIPAMQQVIVDGLQWLNIKEFADAIAMGQITPGPIFISATFIGYKMAGVTGAVTATAAIFFPPGFLMLFCSRFLDQIKISGFIIALFKGLRPAIIGMIFSASFTIMKGVDIGWQTVLIFIVVLFLSISYKVNVAYLIPASGVAGMLLF
ncbi:MAG: chromate efflux transporter [Prolixibacteraceae bacterium]|nr:chromate efflux transporter [Prolixibacteraceae bacterium]